MVVLGRGWNKFVKDVSPNDSVLTIVGMIAIPVIKIFYFFSVGGEIDCGKGFQRLVVAEEDIGS